MWVSQPVQLGCETGNFNVFWPYQSVYPINEQGFTTQFDQIPRQYYVQAVPLSPCYIDQGFYSVNCEDDMNFQRFQQGEQQTGGMLSRQVERSQQIDRLDRKIAKMLRLAEQEGAVDPEFADSCRGLTEDLIVCRNVLLQDAQARTRERPKHVTGGTQTQSPISAAGDSKLEYVEPNRLMRDMPENSIDRPCLGQPLLERDFGVSIDIPYLDPTEILGVKLGHDDILQFQEVDLSQEKSSLSIATKSDSGLDCSNTTASDMASVCNENSTDGFEFNGFRGPRTALIDLNSDIESVGIQTIDCFPLLHRPLSEAVEVKWAKRRLKRVPLGRKTDCDFGQNCGIGENLRAFRWTKRRMKRNFGCGKFDQDIGNPVHSRTNELFRGAGGVNGRNKRRRKTEGMGPNPEFNAEMLSWAEDRMRKWRTATRTAPNHSLEKAEEGPRRGNSKFDRGRKCFGPEQENGEFGRRSGFWLSLSSDYEELPLLVHHETTFR